MKSVESFIKERTSFRQLATGWIAGKCPLCHDYKERGGFKVDGGKILYNCWNCHTAVSYEEHSGQMHQKFKDLLKAFGADDSEITELVGRAFFFKVKEEPTVTLDSIQKKITTAHPIKLPSEFIRLGSTEEYMEEQCAIVDYIEARKINVLSYPFFFAPTSKKFKDHVIIPYYSNGQPIFWQARSIIPGAGRYLNAPQTREAVLFNLDKLTRNSDLPVFITEGVFDALTLDGVGLAGSSINETKLEILKRSQRRKIFVIDKDKNGGHIGKLALANGWEITFPPGGADDANSSAQRYGVSWTVFELMRGACVGDEARLKLNLFCRNYG